MALPILVERLSALAAFTKLSGLLDTTRQRGHCRRFDMQYLAAHGDGTICSGAGHDFY